MSPPPYFGLTYTTRLHGKPKHTHNSLYTCNTTVLKNLTNYLIKLYIKFAFELNLIGME